MNREHNLTRLRNLSAEKPTTKMGQVRWLWPEIQVARAAGHTLQLIHKRLNEAGIEIDYRTLSLYIGRLERQQARLGIQNEAAARPAKKENSNGGPLRSETGLETAAADPFVNIRGEREKKKRGGF